jgi:thiamine-phosphate pyrophosphorylase
MIQSLITDSSYYSQTPQKLVHQLTKSYKNYHPKMVTFRDKSNRNPHRLIAAFVKRAKHLGIQEIFINSHIHYALLYKASGVHLTSRQFSRIKRAKSLGLKVAISTHTQTEIAKALRLGADYIYYSPIFATPGKGEPKGLEELKRVNATMRAKIIALGGITTPAQIKAIKECKVYGFASIRYFLKEKNGI